MIDPVVEDTTIATEWGNDVAAEVNAIIPGDPAGRIEGYVGTTAPSGWLLINGQTVANASTQYPELWAVVPSTWKDGSSLVLPDWREKTLGGFKAASATHGTLGGSAGANTKTIASANLPEHTHSINHNHSSFATSGSDGSHSHAVSGSATSDGSHNHTPGDGGGHNFVTVTGGVVGFQLAPGGSQTVAANYNVTGTGGAHTHGLSATATSSGSNHAHTIDVPNFEGTSGDGDFANTALDVLNAVGVVNWIIRAK